jgi:SAM-dependent methyltransferase
LSFDWYRFREFDRDTVRAAREPYLEYFAEQGPLLDVGCGRGEFLDAARDRGFDALGIDLDPAAIDAARSAGLRAEVADALEFLPAHADEFGGIFCAHVVEHLEPAATAALIRAAAAALRPGGVLCLVSPNPGSLPTITHEFWRDPSHTRPYDIEALAFLCGRAGLEVTASGVDVSSPRGFAIDPADLDLSEIEFPTETVPESQPRLAGAVASQFQRSRLAAEMRSTIHHQQMRIDHLENQLGKVANALQRLVEVLYEPSEIFVVATRPGAG